MKSIGFSAHLLKGLVEWGGGGKSLEALLLGPAG